MWPPVTETWRIPFPIVIALVMNFFVALAVWPGFMSWDSFLALKQLRTGITVSAYPPMVSYMWALPDLLVPGPGGMLLLQNGALFVGLGMIFYAMKLSNVTVIALFFLFVASPILIGPMLVVWKDVGMSACLVLTVAMSVFYMRRGQFRYLVAAMLFLTIGGSYRLNSFTALLPLIFAIALLASLWRQSDPKPWFCARSVGLAAGLASAALGFIVLSVSFRLPDLKPLPLTFNAEWSQVFDLIGISACAERVLVPDQLMRRPMSIDDIKRIYNPRHVQLSFDMTSPGDPALLRPTFGSKEQIQHMWFRTISTYPGCYVMHRLRLLMYLVGANAGEVFYLTHGGIDQNDLGIAMTPTALTSRILHIVTSGGPLARLWTFMLAAMIAMFWLYARNRASFWMAAILMTSGLSYLTGNVFVLPAADARYQHWVAICMFGIIVLGVKELELVVWKVAHHYRSNHRRSSPLLGGHPGDAGSVRADDQAPGGKRSM
jgi:hypothetical protein